MRRAAAGGGGGQPRSAVSETDYHQQAEDRSAADVAELLHKRALSNDFAGLAIIAAPRWLGELRKHLHKEVEHRIVLQLPKEMTDRPIPDIEALLAGETEPSA